MPKQPFVAVGKVLRVRFAGVNQSAPWVNGFAIQYDGAAPDALALTNLAGTLGSLWMTHFGGLLTTLTTLNLVQVWDLSSDTSPSGADNTTHNGQTTALSALPVQSAVVVSWPVQQRWRGGHFRTYLPARTITDITNGRVLTSTTISSYANAAKAFKNAVNIITGSFAPIRLGGVRYFPTGFDETGKPIPKTEGRFLFFNDPVCHNRLDSQRRRSGKEIV